MCRDPGDGNLALWRNRKGQSRWKGREEQVAPREVSSAWALGSPGILALASVQWAIIEGF